MDAVGVAMTFKLKLPGWCISQEIMNHKRLSQNTVGELGNSKTGLKLSLLKLPVVRDASPIEE